MRTVPYTMNKQAQTIVNTSPTHCELGTGLTLYLKINPLRIGPPQSTHTSYTLMASFYKTENAEELITNGDKLRAVGSVTFGGRNVFW